MTSLQHIGLPRRRLGPRGRFAAASLISQVALAALLFGLSVMTSRLLGPAGKGEFSAWTLATTAGAVLLGGSLSIGAGRAYLDQKRGSLAPSAVRHGTLAGVILAPASAVALLAGVPAVPLLCCITLSIPFFVTTGDLLVVMQAAKRPWSFYAIRLTAVIPIVTGLVAIALTGGSGQERILDLAFGLWAVGIVAGGIAAVLIARRTLGYASPGSVRELARRGAGSYGSLIGDWIVLRADRYVVVAVVGTAGLGIFSVAASWAEICLLAGHSIGQAMFEDEKTLDQAAAKRILFHAAWLVAIASAGIAAAAFFLIEPLFGADFAAAKWATLLLAPGMVARTLGYAASSILLARGKGRQVTQIMVVTVACALPAWILGAALAGFKGAAAVSTLVYVLQMLLSLRALSWLRPAATDSRAA